MKTLDRPPAVDERRQRFVRLLNACGLDLEQARAALRLIEVRRRIRRHQPPSAR